MKSILLTACLLTTSTAFSFNAYDLGLHGLYPRQHFHTVDLQPPVPRITRWDSRCDPGHLFITPRGPLVTGAARGPVVLDAKGGLLWMDNTRWTQAMNLNVQRYKDKDYLTFWTKTVTPKSNAKSKKSFVMVRLMFSTSTSFVNSRGQLDSSYEVAYQITPEGKGRQGDSHEFRITPQGTALVAMYHKQQMDCSDLKLGNSCWIQDGWFQEIDIETGRSIFEWHATDHVHMKDVHSSPSRKDGHGRSKADAFDYFHLNAIDKTDDGDYILSARYMHAILCISGKTGEILWQLGGKNNNFTSSDGGALDFAWQHHVSWQGNNTISFFDNHANHVLHNPSSPSKGMLIHMDLKTMTATLLAKYIHPHKILTVSQGSVQLLPETGNVLVGFGNSPTYVEYTKSGEALCSAHYAPYLNYEVLDLGLAKSYRVFKSPWVGKPRSRPDVSATAAGEVYVSWNGATEVSSWRLQSANSRGGDDDFITVQELERTGFETAFRLDDNDDKTHRYLRLVALDKGGVVLGTSAVIERPLSMSSVSTYPRSWEGRLIFIVLNNH